jgi:CheY-like chemotaxis protein
MSPGDANNLKMATILLVEDDDGDAKAVQRAFLKARIANPILRAVDGVEALEMLSDKRVTSPYLTLVDINMPRMSGIEFVKALRSEEDLRRTIVFILTTSKRDEDKLAAYNLNVAGYIYKESAGEDFLRLIDMLDSYWRIVELPS